jgi:membrane protein
VPALSGDLAFRYFTALFPFVVFLATVGGLLSGALGIENPAQRIVAIGADALPREAADVVRPSLEELLAARYRALLPFGLVGALVSATAATNSTVRALNRAHGVRETRAAGHRWLVAFGLTIAWGVLLTAAFTLALVGQALIAPFGGALLSGLLVGLGEWVLIIALLLGAAALVYWAAPNVQQPLKWATPGALLFAGGWVVATWGLRLYLEHAAKATVYGALGGVWVTLVWFYVVATLLILGAELNAALDDRPSLPEIADRVLQPVEEVKRHAA